MYQMLGSAGQINQQDPEYQNWKKFNPGKPDAEFTNWQKSKYGATSQAQGAGFNPMNVAAKQNSSDMPEAYKKDPDMYNFRKEQMDLFRKNFPSLQKFPDATQQMMTPQYVNTQITNVPKFSTSNLVATKVQPKSVVYNKANVRSAEEIAPSGIQDFNQVASNEGNDLLGKSAGRASELLDYQRDVDSGYKDYVSRSVAAVMRALGKGLADAQKQTDTQMARTGLGNSGFSLKARNKNVQDFSDLQADNETNILNQAESWRREDIAANEAIRQNAINLANATSGEQFSRGLQRDTFANNAIGQNNAQRMSEADFQRSGRMFDVQTALEQAARDFQAQQFNAGQKMQADQFNAGQDLDVQTSNRDYDRASLQQDFENMSQATQYNNQLARQLGLDQTKGIIEARNDNYSRQLQNIQLILNALGIGANSTGQTADAYARAQEAAANRASAEAQAESESSSNALGALLGFAGKAFKFF